MKFKNYFSLFLFFLFFSSLMAQDRESKATDFGFLAEPMYVPSIAEQIKKGTFVPDKSVTGNRTPGEVINPKLKHVNNVVPGKGFPKGPDPLVNENENQLRYPGRSPILTFEANTAQFTPSDPTGAAGPNHYIGGWNIGFQIFNKNGTPAAPAASLGTIFPGNTLGDPIILYDAAVDRFIITQFDNNPNGFNVAVSQGPDPVNSGWYVYQGQFGTGNFPDYTKFSIWHDGYYVTANISGTNKLFVVERAKMLLGQTAQFVALPLPGIATGGFLSPQVFSATGPNLPTTPATVVYMQDDAWGGVTTDHLKLWTVNIDWSTPTNSSISTAVQIPVTPFIGVFDGGNFANLAQPGGGQLIDAMQATIMNQAQLRKFPAHNSAVFNFVVDVDPTAVKQAGVRWYELRQPAAGGAWTIHQEGTYTSPGKKSAFAGSMAMDVQGNIGMTYTTVGTINVQERIAIKYTGRFASDPLGTMTVAETPIGLSTANNPNTRYADYTHLTVDPADDKTFWVNTEYFNTARKNLVSAFKIAPDVANDVGVIAINQPNDGTLSTTETVEITVRNFGTTSQSNFNVTYSVDGGTVVTEAFTGTIAPESNATFTFTTTANLGTLGQTYSITASTALTGDEFTANDGLTKDVTYLQANDIGITAITSPVSGSGLTNAEVVTVEVTNFGGSSQSNFNVSYTLDSGPTVTESIAGPLGIGQTLNYNFTQTANLSSLGTYTLTATTSLAGDVDITNDSTTVTVSNLSCQPQSDCSDNDGLTKFVLQQINVTSIPCNATGYYDFTNLSATLDASVGNYTAIIRSGFADNAFSGWIDYNDNGVFETTEQIFQDVPVSTANVDVNVPFSIPTNTLNGQHLMRVRGKWISGGGNLNNPCEDLQYGKTIDFTATIINGTLGVNDLALNKADFMVLSQGNNQFQAVLTTTEDLSSKVFIKVYNVLGQVVAYNLLDNDNGRYTYDLDMSYASSGVYLVRVGSTSFGKVKRIVVK